MHVPSNVQTTYSTFYTKSWTPPLLHCIGSSTHALTNWGNQCNSRFSPFIKENQIFLPSFIFIFIYGFLYSLSPPPIPIWCDIVPIPRSLLIDYSTPSSFTTTHRTPPPPLPSFLPAFLSSNVRGELVFRAGLNYGGEVHRSWKKGCFSIAIGQKCNSWPVGVYTRRPVDFVKTPVELGKWRMWNRCLK